MTDARRHRRRALFAAMILSFAPWLAVGQLATHRVARIEVLLLRHPEPAERDDNLTALLRGLHELGYVEGTNLWILLRFADGHTDRLPGHAAEWVKMVAAKRRPQQTKQCRPLRQIGPPHTSDRVLWSRSCCATEISPTLQ
jgi:hypothetical protein